MREITSDFDLACRACSRLAILLDDVAAEYANNHADVELLLVALAPGTDRTNVTRHPLSSESHE